MITILQIRREIIHPLKLRRMEDIVDSQQMLEISESVHIPMSVGLKTIIQFFSFYRLIYI